MRDTSTDINSYDPIQRDFHWLMAAVILTAICVGIYAADLPKEDATRGFWFGIHKSLGMTAFFLAILRIGWRLLKSTPRYRVPLGRFTALAAWAAHSALYILMVAVPIGGYRPVDGVRPSSDVVRPLYLSEPGPCRQIPGQARRRRSCHRRLDLGDVIGLHIAAAVWHHWFKRDEVMARMAPRLTRKSSEKV